MINYKELAYERINKLEEMLKTYSSIPTNFIYIDIFKSVQQFYFQEQYRKVIAICDTFIILDGVSEQNMNNKGD